MRRTQRIYLGAFACRPGEEGASRCNYGQLCGVPMVGGRDAGQILTGKRQISVQHCGMSSSQATVIFACRKCGAGYQATQKLRSEGNRGSYACQVCRAEVFAWSGSYAYVDWHPVEITLRHPSR